MFIALCLTRWNVEEGAGTATFFEKGLSFISTTIGWLKCPKSTSHAGIREETKGGIKGGGMRLDGIWMTGCGDEKEACLSEAVEFLQAVVARKMEHQNVSARAPAPQRKEDSTNMEPTTINIWSVPKFNPSQG